MEKRYLKRRKTALLSAAAMASLLGVWGNTAAAEEVTPKSLQELTAPELQTEEGAAVYARLKIGDWLDYGDYGLERTDIPGTAYFFYITTKDEQENVINDMDLAYCIQSYFLTPLPGDHSDEMTDHITAVGGKTTLNRILYYGYGGPAYDKTEFEAFLEQENAEYFETVYAKLEAHEQEEVSYILTHGAASYAYFTDATSFEEYLKLQFEIRYGEGWERQYGYFKEQELEKAGIQDGNMDLLGATYGMNEEGIALTESWYEVLADKQDPGLDVLCEDGAYTFYGNEKNEELELEFVVPENFACTVLHADGSEGQATGGETVMVAPMEQFSFIFTGTQVFAESDGITDLTEGVTGTLGGAEEEVWSLVLLETNKGNTESVTKRQQDIAGISKIDADKREISFDIELEKGAITVMLADEEAQPVSGAVFGVYYDEACELPVSQDKVDVTLTTDENGEAYLEFIVNEALLENGNKLYIKELEAPTGYTGEEAVYVIGAGERAEIVNGRETIAIGGTVSWNVPDETFLPEEVPVSLMKDGEVIDTKTVAAEDDWAYVWEDLVKYQADEAGEMKESAYEVFAEPVEGFEIKVDGYDVQGTIVGDTAIEGQLVWEDEGDQDQLRPESVTVELYRDEESVDSLEIDGTDNWRYQFEELPQYSEDGLEVYTYLVGITAPEGYEITMEDGRIVAVHEVLPEPETEAVTEVSAESETEAIMEEAAEAETELVTEEAVGEETELTGKTANDTRKEAADGAENQEKAGKNMGILSVVMILVIFVLIVFWFMRKRRR